MFRKTPIVLNGIELPERDAHITSIINDIALYDDGTYVAVSGGSLVEGRIPEDGELTINGMTMTVSRGNVNVRGSSISNVRGTTITQIGGNGVLQIGSIGGIASVVGTIVASGTGADAYEIDESYAVSPGDRISVEGLNSSVALYLQEGTDVCLKGTIGERPSYSRGRLSAEEFGGDLVLPRISGLELKLELANGAVTGDVIHPGSIETMNGMIGLDVYAPLEIRTSTLNGRIDVRGMMSEGGGRYVPPTGRSQGVLKLETLNGGITVRYRADGNQ
jgi:hypothetical protein